MSRQCNMTRAHYEAIAECLRDVKPKAETFTDPEGCALNLREDIVDRFAAEFHATNPRFDESRFRAACGVDQ